jgi:hypothetical protein
MMGASMLMPPNSAKAYRISRKIIRKASVLLI